MGTNKTNEDDKKIGKKIKFFRLINDMTQIKFGEIMNISEQRVSNIEAGKSKVKASELVKLSDYLNIELNWFMNKYIITYEVKEIKI